MVLLFDCCFCYNYNGGHYRGYWPLKGEAMNKYRFIRVKGFNGHLRVPDYALLGFGFAHISDWQANKLKRAGIQESASIFSSEFLNSEKPLAKNGDSYAVCCSTRLM